MDNGNKIDIEKPEVKLFLQEDLLPSRKGNPDLYNLNDEYAKTRSKKISFVTKVLLWCFLGVGLITTGLVMFIQNSNDNIKIDIAVFDDLNLKGLLDVVSKTQRQLDDAVRSKNRLLIELDNKVKTFAVEKETELQLVESLNLSLAEKKKRINTANKTYEDNEQLLNEEYQLQIGMIDSEIEELTKQLASYDSANIEMAKQQESAINSQRKAFDLEKESLIQDYELRISDLMMQIQDMQKNQVSSQGDAINALKQEHLKEISVLDPTFTDERSNELVMSVIEDIIIEEAMALAVNHIEEMERAEESSTTETEIIEAPTEEKTYLPEVILNLTDKEFEQHVKAALNQLEYRLEDFHYVTNVVSTVPWLNSLKEYIIALTGMTNSIINDAVLASLDFLQQQEQVIVERDKEIEELQGEIVAFEHKIKKMYEDYEEIEKVLAEYEIVLESLDARTKQNGEAGYLLDVSDKNNITIFISTVYRDSVKDGTQAYVFRESGTIIGTVTIKRRGSILYAIANDDDVAQKLMVNDSFLLDLVQ